MMWEFEQRFANCSFESTLKSGHNLHINHQCIRVLAFLLKASKHSGMQNNNTCFDNQIGSFDSLSIDRSALQGFKRFLKDFQSVVQMSQTAVACHIC